VPNPSTTNTHHSPSNTAPVDRQQRSGRGTRPGPGSTGSRHSLPVNDDEGERANSKRQNPQRWASCRRMIAGASIDVGATAHTHILRQAQHSTSPHRTARPYCGTRIDDIHNKRGWRGSFQQSHKGRALAAADVFERWIVRQLDALREAQPSDPVRPRTAGAPELPRASRQPRARAGSGERPSHSGAPDRAKRGPGTLCASCSSSGTWSSATRCGAAHRKTTTWAATATATATESTTRRLESLMSPLQVWGPQGTCYGSRTRNRRGMWRRNQP
jgi:hypothetical protein